MHMRGGSVTYPLRQRHAGREGHHAAVHVALGNKHQGATLRDSSVQQTGRMSNLCSKTIEGHGANKGAAVCIAAASLKAAAISLPLPPTPY